MWDLNSIEGGNRTRYLRENHSIQWDKLLKKPRGRMLVVFREQSVNKCG